MSPLHVAAKKGECREIVEYLINKGTDINIKDYNGVSETIVLCPLFIYFAVQSFLTFKL